MVTAICGALYRGSQPPVKANADVCANQLDFARYAVALGELSSTVERHYERRTVADIITDPALPGVRSLPSARGGDRISLPTPGRCRVAEAILNCNNRASMSAAAR